MSTENPSRLPSASSPRPRRALTLAALVVATAVLGLAWAGNLEPPGPPGPTMKTLDQIPPTWSRILPADDGDAEGCDSSRFECVANRQWVLDHETGLVWRRTVFLGSAGHNWENARRCGSSVVDGWRLPTPLELGSLRVFPTNTDVHGLPLGHPFVLIGSSQNHAFWTMTSSASDFTQAWAMEFTNPPLGLHTAPKTAFNQRWCVRTPHPGIALY